MNRDKLFAYLKQQDANVLLGLLGNCFDAMSMQNIRDVFYHLEDKFVSQFPTDGNTVLENIQTFQKKSLQGDYYAPFDINSKNCMDIPEETEMWFEKLAELLLECTRLSAQGDHTIAVECFNKLFELMDQMESGNDEIIFADEYGMWMLPIYKKQYIKAYLESSAKILNPEEYVETILPLLSRDSRESCHNKIYENAIRTANTKQKTLLDEHIIKNKIKTQSASVGT
jgi:hypothetical protein